MNKEQLKELIWEIIILAVNSPHTEFKKTDDKVDYLAERLSLVLTPKDI